MVRVALIAWPLRLSDILFDRSAVGVCRPRFVHDVSSLALSINREAVFARKLHGGSGLRRPAELTVISDDAGDIGHTTIVYLELVLVEDLAQFRLLWEMFTYQL